MKLGGKLTLFRRPSRRPVTPDCCLSVLAREPVQLISRRANFVFIEIRAVLRDINILLLCSVRDNRKEKYRHCSVSREMCILEINQIKR